MTATAEARTPWHDWIGRTERKTEVIDLEPARRLLAILDDTTTSLDNGSILPPCFHWMSFVGTTPTADLSPDAQPGYGPIMPPVDLPRLMFAGTRVSWPGDLIIGKETERVGELTGVTEKHGKAGRLVFVERTFRYYQDGALKLEEATTGVFREEGAKQAAPGDLSGTFADLPEGAWSRIHHPDPVMLLRYSCVTFNPHRIHYDREWAVEVEGYPGLVIHGPLTATLIIELVRANTDRKVTSFDFRARAPLYDLGPLRVVGIPDGDSVALRAEGPDGAIAMEASATLG